MTAMDRMGQGINNACGRALSSAIASEDGEYCAIFVVPAVAALWQEEGNYYSGRPGPGGYDYNHLTDLCVEALRISITRHYPHFLHPGVYWAVQTMRDMGYEERLDFAKDLKVNYN